MKKSDKEEVKKIVEEALEENTKELKKEKKSKKKIIIISSIIVGLLLIATIVFLLLFIFKPKYKVVLNNGGGIITKEVVIKDNVVEEMPEITPPEGKILVSWINKKKEVVRKGIQLEENDTWNPVFGPEEGEYVTVKFETGTDEKIDDLKILKGTELYLPVKPNNYKDWKFLYWIDKDGYVALAGTKVNEDMTIYAYWWKPSSGGSTEEKVTIKFDTGTKEKFEPIELLKGSKYIFVTPTEPNGDKVFRGWLDDKGELLTSESIVEKSMTLKANWKEPYTCPENCTPNSDGKTCVQQTTVDPTKEMICQGTEYRGYCIDTKNISDQDCARQCASGYPFGDTEVDYPVASRYLPEYDMTSSVCCAKKIDRVERNTCPEGYERDGEKCTKTETINCTAN